MKLFTSFFALAALVFALTSAAFASPHYTLITILHTNDMHAQVMPRDASGGLARAATIIKQIRADMPNVLLLDGGDNIHGSPEDYLSGGKAIISAMNVVGYEAVTTGNHEYDFGLDTLKNAMILAQFPFLAANARSASGGQWDRVEPYKIFTIDGVRVAVLGLTTLETISLHWPQSIKDITIEDPMQVAATYVPQLRKEADVVVVLSHLGDVQDAILAQKVPGIDFIVGGHTHTVINDWRWVGDTLITQAGSNAEYVGRIDFIVKSDEQGKSIVSVNGKNGLWSDLVRQPLGKQYPPLPLIAVDASVPMDPAVVSAYMPYRKVADAQLSEVVGTATVDIPGRTRGSVESAAGDLVADAVRALAKSDVALVDASSVSESGLPAGPLTVGSAHNLIGGYTRQQVVVCKMSGRDLEAAIVANIARKHNLGLAVSGASVSYSSADDVAVKINSAPIDPDKAYTVAAQAYVMMDIMQKVTGVTVLAGPNATTREAIAEYFRSQHTIKAPALDRVLRNK